MTPPPKILIVDDEPTLRLGFSLALKTEHYEVTAAANGREALDKVEKESFDVTVLDLRMPELDGLATLSRLRQAGRDLPVILCSAHINASNAMAALEQQCFDFLCKPVRPQELRQSVERVLSQEDGEPFSRMLALLRQQKYAEALAILDSLNREQSVSLRFWHEVVSDLAAGRPLETDHYVESYGQDLVNLLTFED
ncbi:response regulator [Roseibacillus ishigakijimensis]|uniref:Response regulator n=1 Tax=Roseibacillus ishigakijimensis TaxID=454146 RepID=A0A934RRU3_9BACT|nr:response regulator [Roseibacillus ishigakijimensis]MBK1833085.1 response regulator [Roseibacillus ishigakijimensis]